MTGLGRPPRTARSLQNKEQLARSHRTRPPPADTRRACCHVLSSFQRTGLARPPVIGLSAVVRRTFQTYQPANLVSSLNFEPFRFDSAWPRFPSRPLEVPREGRRIARLASRIHTRAPVNCGVAQVGVASPAMPTSEAWCLAVSRTWRSGCAPSAFDVGRRSASLARPSPCGEPDEYTALCRSCQQGIAKSLRRQARPLSGFMVRPC